MSFVVEDFVIEIDGWWVVDGILFEVLDGVWLGLIGEFGFGKLFIVFVVFGLLFDGVIVCGSICWNGMELVGMLDCELV